jgi:hypothetical protein
MHAAARGDSLARNCVTEHGRDAAAALVAMVATGSALPEAHRPLPKLDIKFLSILLLLLAFVEVELQKVLGPKLLLSMVRRHRCGRLLIIHSCLPKLPIPPYYRWANPRHPSLVTLGPTTHISECTYRGMQPPLARPLHRRCVITQARARRHGDGGSGIGRNYPLHVGRGGP